MQVIFDILPRISLHCKLVPVQYWEYEYGLLIVKGSSQRFTFLGRSEWLRNLENNLKNPLVCLDRIKFGVQNKNVRIKTIKLL